MCEGDIENVSVPLRGAYVMFFSWISLRAALREILPCLSAWALPCRYLWEKRRKKKSNPTADDQRVHKENAFQIHKRYD